MKEEGKDGRDHEGKGRGGRKGLWREKKGWKGPRR